MTSSSKLSLLALYVAIAFNTIAVALLQMGLFVERAEDAPVSYRYVAGYIVSILAFGCCLLASFLHARTRKWKLFQKPLITLTSISAILVLAIFLQAMAWIFSACILQIVGTLFHVRW